MGVLDLVEQPLDQPRGVEAEVAADQVGRSASPAAASRTPERISSPGSRARPRRRRRHRRRPCARAPSGIERTRRRSPRGPSPRSSITTRRTSQSACSSSSDVDPRRLDVGVQRRLAGVRRAALQARAAAHAVGVRVGDHRLELGAERREARGITVWTHVCQSWRSRTPSRCSTRSRWGSRSVSANGSPRSFSEARRGVPLLVVLCGRAQRHLCVDRRRPADAAAAEHRSSVARRAGGRLGERERPPQLVSRAGPPSACSRRRSCAGRPRAAARCGRARPARPRSTPPPAPEPTTITSYALAHPRTPRYDQSLFESRRERRSEVDLLPGAGPGRPGRDEVAVERLARERSDHHELRRERVLGERLPAPAAGRSSASNAPIAASRSPSGIRASRASMYTSGPTRLRPGHDQLAQRSDDSERRARRGPPSRQLLRRGSVTATYVATYRLALGSAKPVVHATGCTA